MKTLEEVISEMPPDRQEQIKKRGQKLIDAEYMALARKLMERFKVTLAYLAKK